MKTLSLVMIFGFINAIMIRSPVNGYAVGLQPKCGCPACDVRYVTNELKPCASVALGPALEFGVCPGAPACGCGPLDMSLGFLDLYAACGCGLPECPCPKYLRRMPIPPPFL